VFVVNQFRSFFSCAEITKWHELYGNAMAVPYEVFSWSDTDSMQYNGISVNLSILWFDCFDNTLLLLICSISILRKASNALNLNSVVHFYMYNIKGK
jgi:hypothetical protein